MLISCSACGKIHDRKKECSAKKMRKHTKMKQYTEAVRIRNRNLWKRTREMILRRDNYMCQACARQAPGTSRQYNAEHLEVHHIIPLEEDIELAYEENNLLTLCRKHHEDAESGILTRAWQQGVVWQQLTKEEK